MSKNALNIEQAKIITISTIHLHPDTLHALQNARGDLSEGPSVAVREEGFLLNSHLNTDDAIDHDFRSGLYRPMAERYPDIVLISALARGLGAEWINIDRDGVECSDILPSYDEHGAVSFPTGDGWKDALGTVEVNAWGNPAVMPDRDTIGIIESGQTPGLTEAPAP